MEEAEEVAPLQNEWFTEETLRSNGLGGMANFLNAIQNPANIADTPQNNQILSDLILLIIADTKHDLDVNLIEHEKILSIILSIPGIFADHGPLTELNTLLVSTDGTLTPIEERLGIIRNFRLNLPDGTTPRLENLVGATGALGRVTEDAAVVTVGGNNLHTYLRKGNYGSFRFGLRSDNSNIQGNTQPWSIMNIKFKETLKDLATPPQQYIPAEGCITKHRGPSEPDNYDKLYIHDIIQQLLRIAHIVPAAAAGGVTTYKICLSVDDNTLINKLIENRHTIGLHILNILGGDKVLQINVLVLKESFIDPGNAPQRNATIPELASGNEPRIEIILIRHANTAERYTAGTINDGEPTTWRWVPPNTAASEIEPHPNLNYKKLYYSNHNITAQPLVDANIGNFEVGISNPVFPYLQNWRHHFTATTRKTKFTTNCISCISELTRQTIKIVSTQIDFVSRLTLPITRPGSEALRRSALNTYTKFLAKTFQNSYLYMSKRMGDCGLGFTFYRVIQEKGIRNFKEMYGTPVCISKDRLAIMFYLLSGINCIKCSDDYTMLSFMTHEHNMTITRAQLLSVFESIKQILRNLNGSIQPGTPKKHRAWQTCFAYTSFD